MPSDLNLFHAAFASRLKYSINMKTFGPYMRNGKQFWRNYHRLIKRKDAKTFIEVQYLKLPIEYKPLFELTKETK